MKWLYVLSCLALIACLGNAQGIYRDCGGKVGTLKNVTVSGCTASPCVVKKGMNYTVNATFTTSEATNETWAIVHGILDGTSVPYPIPNPDGCKNSGLKCPLKMGQTYIYSTTLPILKIYPDVKVVVQWELADAKQNGNNLFCMEILIEVVG